MCVEAPLHECVISLQSSPAKVLAAEELATLSVVLDVVYLQRHGEQT